MALEEDLGPELSSSSAADSSEFPNPVRRIVLEKALGLHRARPILAVRLQRQPSPTDWDREEDRPARAESAN